MIGRVECERARVRDEGAGGAVHAGDGEGADDPTGNDHPGPAWTDGPHGSDSAGAMMPIQPMQPGQMMPMQPGQMMPMQPGKPGQMMPGMTFIPVSYPMMRAQMQYPINQNQVYQGMPASSRWRSPSPSSNLSKRTTVNRVFVTPLIFCQEHKFKTVDHLRCLPPFPRSFLLKAVRP